MLYVVAPPLFEGRPEVTIYQDIIDECVRLGIEHTPVSEGIYDPVKLGGVYTSPVMASYYSRITLDLTLKIKDGDIVFWVDAWNPAIPVLWHYCTAERIRVKNVGIWHSSPTTEGDYLAGSAWAIDFQDHLLKYLDKIFVATQYMKDSIQTNLSKNNVIVTGLPFDTSKLKPSLVKKHSIAFGHRWAEDKRHTEFLRMAKLNEKTSNLEFSIFSPYEVEPEVRATWDSISSEYEDTSFPSNIKVYNSLTKEQYYEELGKCEYIYANAVLETFGYFVLEGVLSGAKPWLNLHPCYVELYGTKACYMDINRHNVDIMCQEGRWTPERAKILQLILDTSVSNMIKNTVM